MKKKSISNYSSRIIENKILNDDNLNTTIKNLKKKNKKIVLCHGTFDIVHPGHIRHLIYAKKLGDILIASTTGDKYVEKKTYGTFVPEKLRVKNLASLEFVDYTFIDKNKTPLKSINKIKPNYFVKGYEYKKLNNPNTVQEKKIVEKNKGKIIFTPGDVVFSSTEIQKKDRPDIRYDRLMSLLENEKIEIKNLEKLIQDKKKINIHVVGDLIIDKYNYCEITGQSLKTPTFSIKPYNSKTYIGGAGIIAMHLKNLGANVTFTSVTGNDDVKKFAEKKFIKMGIKTNFIINKKRKTSLKERFWSNNYKLIQVNYVDNNIIDNEEFEKIRRFILSVKSDLIVFSDFRHGIFNSENSKKFISAAKKNKNRTIVADTQVSSRWGNILDFKGIDIIFPNEAEARFALGDQDSGVRFIGTNLLNKSKSKHVVLKLGDKGSMVFTKSGLKPKDFFPIDNYVEYLKDGIGAGDAYLSTTSFFYFKTKNIKISTILGSFSAAIACEQSGNVPISKNQIIQKLKKFLINK